MKCLDKLIWPLDHLIRAYLTGCDTWLWHRYGHSMLWQKWKENWQARSWVTASLNKGRFAANDIGKARPLQFSGKLLKDTGKNCSCQWCELSVPCLCCQTLSRSGDSSCKCETIVNVKHNLLKPSKEDTRGKLSSLLRSEVRPSTELSHNIC